MNIHKVLIANRGEIACRIIRTLRKMGIESFAVYHDDELPAMHAQAAHRALSLGKGSLAETYLNIDKIIALAKENKADAIHPGYGFLSENSAFSKACQKAGIIFIGPDFGALEQLAHKANAKRIAKLAGAPVLESVNVPTPNELDMDKITYPVLVKAVAGGGGKGMKIVRNTNELAPAFEKAAREAKQYFGDDALMMEPFLEHARHIEVQIIADRHGNYYHLFERECSIQRNYQKIIEEAPATSVAPELKQKLYAAAIKIAKAVGYVNAGTVEFLVDGENFYFLEMNARIQVEHPVTEAISGVDLVELQMKVADNQVLNNTLFPTQVQGHAIELRLYAEQPEKNFAPSTGQIAMADFPSGIRVDTFIEKGTRITPLFDGMLAKIIATGSNRSEAIQSCHSALQQLHVHGLRTNQQYLSAILSSDEFLQNQVHTRFLHAFDYKTKRQFSAVDEPVVLAYAFITQNFLTKETSANPWLKSASWYAHRLITITIDGEPLVFGFYEKDGFIHLHINREEQHPAKILSLTPKGLELLYGQQVYVLHFSEAIDLSCSYYELQQKVYIVKSQHNIHQAVITKHDSGQQTSRNGNVLSPLFGKVLQVHKQANEQVAKDDVLVTIESMKTENHILAPFNANIKEVFVEPGMQVEENKHLISLIPID